MKIHQLVFQLALSLNFKIIHNGRKDIIFPMKSINEEREKFMEVLKDLFLSSFDLFLSNY